MCELTKIKAIVFTNVPLSEIDVDDLKNNPEKYIENGTHTNILTKDNYLTSIE